MSGDSLCRTFGHSSHSAIVTAFYILPGLLFSCRLWFGSVSLRLQRRFRRELDLTNPQLKVLAICNLALTIPARIVIGMVLDRYGPRLTFSSLLVFAIVPCLLTVTAHDFNQLVWSSLINSMMGAGFVVGVRMVGEWFPPQEIGLAQGIYGGWGNFGAAAAQLFLPIVAVVGATFSGGELNWRFAISMIGLVTAVYGGIYFCYTQDTPPGEVYLRPRRHGGLEVTSRRSFWAISLLDLGLLISLGLLTYPLVQADVHFLNLSQVGLDLGNLGVAICFAVLQRMASESGSCGVAQSV